MADTPQTLLGIDTAATGHEHHHHPHIHGHSGNRLRHFFSPEGRKIHVAHSPDEANSLRKAEGEDKDFDFVIHGSPEHWFYCGGLGVSLFCLGIIALTHTHRKIPKQRICKETRVVFRMLVSIIIITLPKAHMNSLQLVATTTGLIIAVLIMELIGSSCWGENMFWERGCGRDKATYSARCVVKREELEISLKDGTVLDVEEIAKRESGEKVVLTGV